MTEDNLQNSEANADSGSPLDRKPKNESDNYDIYDTDIKSEDFTQTFDPSAPVNGNPDPQSPENSELPKEDGADEQYLNEGREKIVYDLEATPMPPPPPPESEVPKDGAHEDVPRATVIYRGGWGALPSKDPPAPPLAHPIDSVIFLHTGPGTEECNGIFECSERLQEMQRKHMYDKGMPDIQYNFMVSSDNTVYEGRGWHRSATKDILYKHFDGRSLDICFIGDFSRNNPPNDMMKTALTVLGDGVVNNYVRDIIDFCPIRSTVPVKVDLAHHFRAKDTQ